MGNIASTIISLALLFTGLFDEQGLLYFDDLLRLVLRSNRFCELGEFWSARFQSA
ncbi:hypothetical protein Sjap_018927 [Stephania japonica]|uniref:Uncharacterized protein n=1 Tax=Stephania japonica TaxID=461633 RepID=A0AAP0I8W9_9MAGN